MDAEPSPLELADAALAGQDGPVLACVVRRRVVGASRDATGAVNEESRTTTSVHLTRPGPGHPGLPAGAAPARAHEGFDLATAGAAPGALARLLAQAAAAAQATGNGPLQVTGEARASRTTIALAASTGLRATDDVTDAWLQVAAADPGVGRAGRAQAAGRALRALDPADVARRAAARAPRSAPAPAPSPGARTVVLGAEAVAVLLDVLGRTAFDGRAHAAGRGPLAGRLGTRVAASAINLADTPRFPRTLARAWDAEGVAKVPIPLIQDGVAHRVVHDLASAAAAGTAPTGHAVREGSPRPANLVLIGGGAQDEAELAQPVQDGVLIHRLQHVHLLDRASGRIAAVAEEAWAIAAGAVTAPLPALLLTDEPLRLLGATEALGATQELTLVAGADDGDLAHGVACPALRATGVPLAPLGATG